MAKRIFVGSYSEKDIEQKKDLKEVAAAEKKHGLTYTDTKIVVVKGEMRLKIWLIDDETFYNQPLMQDFINNN